MYIYSIVQYFKEIIMDRGFKYILFLGLSLVGMLSASAQNFSMGGMTLSDGKDLTKPVIKSPMRSNLFYRQIIIDLQKNKPDQLAETLASMKTNPKVLDDQLNNYFVSPLFFAIHAKKPQSMATLIRYGASPNHTITAKEYKEFIKEIGHNPIDNKQTLDGTCTPLSFACMYIVTSASDKKQMREMIKQLLDAGANCNDVGFEDKPCALILAERDMQEELQILIDTGKLDFESPVLSKYMKDNKNDKLVKLLETAKTEAAEQAKLDDTEDHLGTADKNPNSKKAKPEYTGHPTLTLEKAIISGNKDQLMKHMGMMSSLDAPIAGNKLKQTPLVFAAYLNSTIAVELFLEYGASWKPEDLYFCNALTYAKMRENEKMIEILENAGAEMPACDSLDMAVKQDRPDKIREFLKKEKRNVSYLKPLLERHIRNSIAIQRLNSFKTLIDEGGNINQMVLNNEPVIFYFIESGLVDFIRASKGKAYDLDLRVLHPTQKVNPLIFAITLCHHNQIDVVKALVEMGADVNYQNRLKKTPLMYAAESGNEELVKVLISLGANTGLKDADGRSYLNYMKKKSGTTSDTGKNTIKTDSDAVVKIVPLGD